MKRKELGEDYKDDVGGAGVFALIAGGMLMGNALGNINKDEE